MIVSDSFKIKFQNSLITWFKSNQRAMPWRETSDPYCILVSEIMLQQTQVATVVDYYRRFIRKFPTVRDLADASAHDVMKAWEGLGYYSRARNLHETAKIIVDRHDGEVPENIEELIKLPGIGRYTAGAVASLAFHKPLPVLDGNIIRVFTRFFHLTDNVSQSGTIRRLWDIAGEMLPERDINPYNQALMELGALVCTPRNPACHECPLRKECRANRLSLQHLLPVKSPKKPIPHLDVTAGVIWKENQFLITLRPPKGLLGGLWEFPGGKLEEGESLEACLKREIREELEIDIQVLSPLIAVKHAYTHFKITLHTFHARYLSGEIVPHDCDEYRWIGIDELDAYAFPGADRKVIDRLKKHPNPGMDVL